MSKRTLFVALSFFIFVAINSTIVASDFNSDGIVDSKLVTRKGSSTNIIIPVTGSILVDRAHGQKFNLSGYMNYLTENGWTVDENNSVITTTILSSYDILLVHYAITAFTQAEIDAIKYFVNNGGGLWLLGEYNKDFTHFNILAEQFGLSFNSNDKVNDPTNNEGEIFWPTIHELATHTTTENVQTYGFYAGCAINVNKPASIVGKGDDDAYSSLYSSYPPVLAVVDFGRGKVVGSGDMTPLHPSYFPSELRTEEKTLLNNIAEWLLSGNTKPFLSIFPGTSRFVLTAGWHAGFVVENTSSPVVGVQVILDGIDITSQAVGAFVHGTLIPKGHTYRVPLIPASFFGLGAHTFEVSATLDNGSTVQNAVVWEVLENTEP